MTDDSGELTLGHILTALGVIDFSNVLVLRHTETDELEPLETVTPEQVLAYTRVQRGRKVAPDPPGTWLVFLADGARRSRFYTAYRNHGELTEQRALASGRRRLSSLARPVLPDGKGSPSVGLTAATTASQRERCAALRLHAAARQAGTFDGMLFCRDGARDQAG